ncbi:MAG: pseudouridine synthase [Victivallaceae bacterium]|nr:pseudouridine synthase [Victivallaceae bacterium]
MERINLSKYLGNSKALSRRAGALAVKAGRVCVNGRIVTDPAFRVPEKSEVTLDGALLTIPQRGVYLALNKPAGYTCTHSDEFAEHPVTELLPDKTLGFAGRLDKDSEGLLLFSNDGDWINRITHPSFEVLKCYYVTTERPLRQADFAKMRAGINHRGEFLKPRKVLPSEDGRGCYFVLNEGKKREIRRLIRGCANEVVLLRRLSTGRIELGNLKSGGFRFLTEKETAAAIVPNALPDTLKFLLEN